MLTKYWKHLLLIVGITLLMNGLIFNYLNWPDAFKGLITGPVIMLIAVIFISKGDSKAPSQRRISSRITGFYKYILPFLLIGTLLACTTLVFIENPLQDLFVGFSIFLSIITIIIIAFSRTIWEVRMDEDYLYFKGFQIEVRKKIADIERVAEDFNGLVYRIDFNDRGYHFLPDFVERIQDLFGVPESIMEIKKRKAAVHNPKK